jgi:hypothetical protein
MKIHIIVGYLAGPMTGYPEHNYRAFDIEAAKLRAKGYIVLSPADHNRQMGFTDGDNQPADFDLRAALLWDLTAVTRSEVVWLLPGWQDSKGCAIEIALARYLKIPVIELEP